MDAELTMRVAQKYNLHTCRYCQLVVMDLQNLPNAPDDPRENSVDLFNGRYTAHKAFQAANDGCDFFRWCILNMKTPGNQSNNFTETLPTTEMEDQLDLVVSIWKTTGVGGGKVFCRISWDCNYEHPEPSMYLRFFRQRNSKQFFLWPPKGDPAASYISQRAVDPSVSSENNFALARRWLGECVEAHPECRGQSYASLPSRVIDVGLGKDSRVLRLVSTNNLRDVSWVTLSYCWGGQQPFQTIRTNLHSRSSTIPFEGLPRTLQDAITVAREMGVRYLWIDSLCIVQDDDDDKAQELYAMADIYEGGVFTISAACSSSCYQGFLYDRTPYEPAVALPTLCPGGRKGLTQLVWNPQEDTHGQPIQSRAWTFQEQILSRRILHYNTHAMRWTCRKSQYHGGERDTTWSEPHKSNFPESGAVSESDLFSKWRGLVENYSDRSLTFPQDRLIALSAVTRRFAEYSNFESAEYLAGLWRKLIIPGLLWGVRVPDASNPEGNDTTLHSVAPSWSWASVFSRVTWSLLNPWVEDADSMRCTAELVNAEVIPMRNGFTFGAIRSGRLTIKGLLTRAVVGEIKAFAAYSCHAFSILQFPLTARADRSNSGLNAKLLEQNAIWCLELFLCPGENGTSGFNASRSDIRHGLLLCPTDQDSEFYRVGTYSQAIRSDIGIEATEDNCHRCVTEYRDAEEKVIHII